MSRIARTLRSLYAEILKFGAVGAVGVCSDVVTSNALWKFTGLSPTVAALFGTSVATVVAYIGNRYWTFRDRPADDRRREMLLFLLISAIGAVIEVGAVFVSDHLLGMHGALADNAAKFGVGLPLGGIFRFWTCHVFVFPEAEAADRAPFDEPAGDPAQRVVAATGE